jgi:predicted nucleotidyltransferase component of viral defense system
LPRFSVDLDFDLTKDLSISQVDQMKNDILKYLQSKLSKIKLYEDINIKIDGNLKNSFRYILQYG